jgi:hypothetical protein
MKVRGALSFILFAAFATSYIIARMHQSRKPPGRSITTPRTSYRFTPN